MNLKNKLISILVLMVIILPMFAIKTYAATGTFSVSPSNVQLDVNGTAQITVTASECAGQFSVTSSDPNIASVNGTGDFLDNSSKTFTVTAKSAGNATITITATDVTDTSENPVEGYIPVNITVNAPQQQEQQPSQQEQPTQPVQPTQQEQPQPAAPVEKDPTFTNTNQTMYTKGNVNLRSSWSTSSAAVLVEKDTELTVTGTSTDSVNGYVWYRVLYNGQTKYIASGLLTDVKPEEKDQEEEKKTEEKSTNKALKDIVVENYKLTPDFDPETTKYTLEVTKEVEKLEITPILQDDKSKFEISGNENFKVGNNIVKITVTAEDGTTRLYTITVSKTNKEAEDDASSNMLKLSKLEIKNIKLSPEFKSTTTNYSIVVSDPASIKIADITAVAEDENVKVTIAEAEADKNGNRVITIMLENEDESKSGVYQVTIKKGIVNPITEMQNNKNQKVYYILGGIIGLLVAAIIVVMVLLKKTSSKYDFQDIKEADELADDYDYSSNNEIEDLSVERKQEYDDLIEDSDLRVQPKPQTKSQPKPKAKSKSSNYNVFNDNDDLGIESLGISDKTKKYDLSNDEKFDDDLRDLDKRKGKHF